jgi:hypothetical protein
MAVLVGLVLAWESSSLYIDSSYRYMVMSGYFILVNVKDYGYPSFRSDVS